MQKYSKNVDTTLMNFIPYAKRDNMKESVRVRTGHMSRRKVLPGNTAWRGNKQIFPTNVSARKNSRDMYVSEINDYTSSKHFAMSNLEGSHTNTTYMQQKIENYAQNHKYNFKN